MGLYVGAVTVEGSVDAVVVLAVLFDLFWLGRSFIKWSDFNRTVLRLPESKVLKNRILGNW